jgi:hypothetical protein
MSTAIFEYIFFFRGTPEHGLSPEEVQRLTNEFVTWAERLSRQGILRTGKPLEREGKVVAGKDERAVSDGPFVVSPDAISGYFLLQAGSLEEAVAIAKECPVLAHGSTLEVRPVAAECPIPVESLKG